MLTPYYHNEPNFTLYKGNCVEILQKLPENSIDMIFADPPYFIHKAEWDISQGAKNDFQFHCNWINECRRVLKPNGTIFITGTQQSIHKCGIALEVKKILSH